MLGVEHWADSPTLGKLSCHKNYRSGNWIALNWEGWRKPLKEAEAHSGL
jgi:hypothetical protein